MLAEASCLPSGLYAMAETGPLCLQMWVPALEIVDYLSGLAYLDHPILTTWGDRVPSRLYATL